MALVDSSFSSFSLMDLMSNSVSFFKSRWPNLSKRRMLKVVR